MANFNNPWQLKNYLANKYQIMKGTAKKPLKKKRKVYEKTTIFGTTYYVRDGAIINKSDIDLKKDKIIKK